MAKVEQKQVIVNEIKEKLSKATSAVLVDARGLTVEQDTRLRKTLREAGVDYKVYKNTMMRFAIEGTEFESLGQHLEGPSTLALCYEDPTVGASILNKFKQEAKALEFKGGVIEGTYYDTKGMEIIADIPSREVLLSRLLGSIQGPVGAFARVIKAIADEKETA
ncbi:MAG: 50S ribosomal protein L10 [Lachnospirales bacterium]